MIFIQCVFGFVHNVSSSDGCPCVCVRACVRAYVVDLYSYVETHKLSAYVVIRNVEYIKNRYCYFNFKGNRFKDFISKRCYSINI